MRYSILPILAAAVMTAFAASCTKDEPVTILPDIPESSEVDELQQEEETVVTFCTSTSHMATKSSILSDDSRINDLNVFVYRDGLLVGSRYESSASSLQMPLVKNATYDFYVLVNAGAAVAAPGRESEIEDLQYAFDPGSVSSHGMPMAGCSRGVAISGSTSTVSIGVKRLFAKICFSVDFSAIGSAQYDFTSVQIRNAANRCTPFREGFRAANPSEVYQGDFASSLDLYKLNRGEEIVFYVPENMQGTLLPGNDDPWMKTPENIGGGASVCTYLQAVTSYSNEPESGTVTFQFYLGEDNSTNFDIERNCEYHVVLVPSDDAVYVDNWKIIADVIREDTNPISFSLNAPAVVGTWGKLTVPSASASDPVTVNISYGYTSQTKDITIGGTQNQTLYFGTYGFLYCASDPTSLYLLASGQTAGGYGVPRLPRFTMTQGSRSAVASVTVDPQYAHFVLDESSLSICEDGGDYGVNLLLSESLYSFETPVAVRSLLPSSFSSQQKKWYYFDSLYYDDFGWGVTDPDAFTYGDDPCDLNVSNRYCGVINNTLHDYVSRYDAWDDGVFATFLFYGLSVKDSDSRTRQLFVPYHDSLYDAEGEYYSEALPFHVLPAFPEQRFIGEYMNYQIAPGSMASSSASISFTGGVTGLIPTYSASWTVRHGVFSTSDRGESALSQVWNNSYNDEYSINLSMTRTRLSFGSDIRNGRFFPSGQMIACGQVTNPHSGRVIRGYYTFDVILYLTVGAQVAPNGYSTSYCFCPFTRYGTQPYYDQWNDYFPLVDIRHQARTASTTYDHGSYVLVPENSDNDPDDWMLSYDHDYQQVFRTTPFKTLAIFYSGLITNGVFDFQFVDTATGIRSNSLDLSRTALQYASSSNYYHLRYGNMGYYRLYRQMDIDNIPDTYTSYGCQNYLLECAYGSFINY